MMNTPTPHKEDSIHSSSLESSFPVMLSEWNDGMVERDHMECWNSGILE